MDVKPGYKQTELGVIPDQWEIVKISSLIEQQAILGHLDGNHGELYPRSHEFKSYGIPYIGANDFADGEVIFERCKFLSPERANQFHKGVAKDGDVLFAHNATVGPVALLQTVAPFVILSTTATYFRCNPEKLNNSYLKFALQSSHFVGQYQSVMAQSTRFQVPISTQRRLSLVIPPLAEQSAIAAALGHVDSLLGGLERLIDKKRDLKQAAMRQLLTRQTRLPGFRQNWELKKIGGFADCTAGGTPSTRVQSYWGGSIRWMSSGELNLKRVNEVDGRITEAGLRNSSAAMLPRRCVLIGLAGQGKTRGTVAMNLVEVSTNQSIAAVLPNLEFVPEYLYYNLDSRYEELREASTGAGGRGGLNLTIIKAIEVGFPTLAEQTAIAAVLSDMDAELLALEARRDKTRALRQGMMQELLTGHIRLI